jgi:hypothetical protein
MKVHWLDARFRGAFIASALPLIIVGAIEAQAHDISSRSKPVYVSTQNQTVKTSLNLFAKAGSGDRKMRARSIGNGSYLCSPAGLGRSSRCARN